MRTVSGPQITLEVLSKQTGAPLGAVTITVNQQVYTDPEMTAAVSSLTTRGDGTASCYAPPGVYTFTAPANATPLEQVEVLGGEYGTGIIDGGSP